MITAEDFQAVAQRLNFSLPDPTLSEPLTVAINGDNNFTFADNGLGVLLVTLSIPLSFWEDDKLVDDLLHSTSSKGARPVRYTVAFLGDNVNFILHMGFTPTADDVVDTILKMIELKKQKFILPDEDEDQ